MSENDKNVSYICETILTSQMMADGKRYDFNPGDPIHESFIAPANLKGHLEAGRLKVTGNVGISAPKVAKIKMSNIKPKSNANKA